MITFASFAGTWSAWVSSHWLALLLAIATAFAIGKIFKTNKKGEQSQSVSIVSTLILAAPLIYVGADAMYNQIYRIQREVSGLSMDSAGEAALAYALPWGIAVPGAIAITSATVAWVLRNKGNSLPYVLLSCALMLSLYFSYQAFGIAQTIAAT